MADFSSQDLNQSTAVNCRIPNAQTPLSHLIKATFNTSGGELVGAEFPQRTHKRIYAVSVLLSFYKGYYLYKDAIGLNGPNIKHICSQQVDLKKKEILKNTYQC